MNKICRYCKTKNASSKEHLIANARLTAIKAHKIDNQNNDNIRKTYKGITCESCNNELGRYEEATLYNLAYATIWKILAGNVNGVFTDKNYLLSNTPNRDIESYEQQFLKIIQTQDAIIPNNTFRFDFYPNKTIIENHFGKAYLNHNFKIKDEKGNPLEGVAVLIKDNSASKQEKCYTSISDSDGSAFLSVLAHAELVKIVAEELLITNEETGEFIIKKIDVIIYLSISFSFAHRLIFILPIIGGFQTTWENALCSIQHKDFLKILQDNLEDITITNLIQYFQDDEIENLLQMKNKDKK